MQDCLTALEAQKAELRSCGAAPPPVAVRIAPHLAEIDARKAAELELPSADGPERAEAMDAIRTMIDQMAPLTRKTDVVGLDAAPHGDVAAIFAA